MYSTLSCDGSESCSPTQCVKNSESDCVFGQGGPDPAANLASTTCRTCTQVETGVCAKLAATIQAGSGVYAAYCTEAFLVIWSTGLPAHDARTSLLKIPLPPGGDAVCRVRTAGSTLTVFKIPLVPAAATLPGRNNSLPRPLGLVPGMPEAGAIGVAIDGVPLFPNFNNRGLPTWVSCEVDKCNAHAGKGQDYHYHGDPYGLGCVYDASAYTAGGHPPLIGWALDGYEVHGKHIAATDLGQVVELDYCGGHEHDGLAYHYHSETRTGQSTNTLDGVPGSGPFAFTAYNLAPTNCWHGNISLISNFWNSAATQANYDRQKDGVAVSNDFQQLRPCCGATLWLTDGVSLVPGAGTCSATGGCKLSARGSAPSSSAPSLLRHGTAFLRLLLAALSVLLFGVSQS